MINRERGHTMFKSIMRGMKGFTLIELLAVMAIVAVLAGIVAVAVSGSGSTSRDAQVQEDGNTAGSSVADFFSDQRGAEFFDTQIPTVLGITNATSGTELISLQCPEAFITDTYAQEFPIGTNNVTTITVLDEDSKESLVS